jgi:DNA-binding MarR family transcriptional regulator/GNAT superfamily N-acetyltransferase
MNSGLLEERVAAVRHFSRFYTARIGMLGEKAYGSKWSLAEARVLYEISRRERPTQTDIARELALDPGYLSRIVRRLEDAGLIVRTPAAHDARIAYIALTARGRRALAPIDRRSHDEIAALIGPLPERSQAALVEAMRAVENTLANAPPKVDIRTHRPGDLGWIVERHGEFYASEFGWGGGLEALVAQVVADFGRSQDAAYERCWIAEADGRRIGSVMLVRESERVARLRMLFVEPVYHGLGIGERLVAQCERFAREAGYERITLWTHNVLVAARKLYAKHGYRLVASEDHEDFGVLVTSETWDLDLTAPSEI